MDASALKRPVVTEFKHFIEMKARAATEQSKTLNKAAKQFEALFLQNMLKSMRQANNFLSDQSPLKSRQGSMFEEMLDQQRALNIANETQGIGLADMMINQLDKTKAAAQHKHNAKHLNGIELPLSEGLRQLAGRKMMLMTPKDFVKAIWPAAKSVAKELGLDPKMLVAQAAHETGWGKRIINDDKGQSSFNLFNIKSSNNDPSKANVLTTEYIDGNAVKVTAPFRTYDSFDDSFSDYVSLIKNNQRYQTALANSSEPEKYMHELQKAGYATDPNYASKVMAVYHGTTLTQSVNAVENK